MKREKENKERKIILYGLLVVALIILIGILIKEGISYYNKYQEESKIKNESDRIADSRIFKREIIEKENGWYYFLSSDGLELNIGEYTYSYNLNGCNIKYATLDYSYATMGDTHIPITPPALATSYRSKNGIKTEKDELNEINSFLKNNSLNGKITADDLGKIEFVNFDAKDIVTLWNESLNREYLEEYGPYTDFSACHFIKENKDKSYFQIGIILNFGNLEIVRIDYIDENGNYLLDKVANNIATKEELKIYENILKISDTIIKKQSFMVEDDYSALKKDETYSPLFILLDNLESKRK